MRDLCASNAELRAANAQLRESLVRVCRLVPGADEIGAELVTAAASASGSNGATAGSHTGTDTGSGGIDIGTGIGTGIGFGNGSGSDSGSGTGTGRVGNAGNGGGPLKYAAFDDVDTKVSVEMSSF
jgi:hypothetical protein